MLVLFYMTTILTHRVYARLGKYVDSYNLYLKDADFIMSSSLDMSPHTISKISNKIYSAEFFLRTNNLEKADDLLNETKKEIDNKIGKNSEFNCKRRLKQ